MMSEIIIMVLSIGFLLFVGIIIGYVIATRDGLKSIENVNRWIETTESNHWVQIELYKDLEIKYEELIKEYEQYKGTIKALKEWGGLNYE